MKLPVARVTRIIAGVLLALSCLLPLAAQPTPSGPERTTANVAREWYLTYHVTITSTPTKKASRKVTVSREAWGTIHYTKALPGDMLSGTVSNLENYVNFRTWTSQKFPDDVEVSVNESTYAREKEVVEGKAFDLVVNKTASSGGGILSLARLAPLLVIDQKTNSYRIGSELLSIPWQSLTVKTGATETRTFWDGRVKTTPSEPRTPPKQIKLVTDPTAANAGKRWIVMGQLADNNRVSSALGSDRNSATFSGLLEGGKGGDGSDVKVTLEWSLSPKPQPLEVIVTLVDYENWLPQGGENEKIPGNLLAIEAVLRAKDGSNLTEKARKFRFEIIDVSREPGVCMNWPAKSSATTDPDLRFEPGPSGLTGLDDDGQRGETAEGYSSSATAVLSCFDWGAHAWLKVTATLANGDEIVGHLAAKPGKNGRSVSPVTTRIPLPKRDEDSYIGDAWKRPNSEQGFNGLAGMSDYDDSETSPVGDRVEGDGLTLYEEYRGFREVYAKIPPDDPGPNEARHTRGDPQRKDLFVSPTTQTLLEQIQHGCRLFADASGLAVHSGVPPEALADREINFNQGSDSRSLHPQHAVRIVGITKDTTDSERIEVLGRGDSGLTVRLHPENGPPKSPKDVKYIILSPAMKYNGLLLRTYPDARTVGEYDQTVAHELGHACGIQHHGDLNRKVTWRRGGGTDGGTDGSAVVLESRSTDPSQRRQISVLFEDGTPVDVNELMKPDPRDIVLAMVGGANSGDQSCLMRYARCESVESASDPNVRYMLAFGRPPDSDTDGDIGIGLCSSPLGTGVNAPPKPPGHLRSVFGDASYQPHGPNRGCRDQLRVNDQ